MEQRAMSFDNINIDQDNLKWMDDASGEELEMDESISSDSEGVVTDNEGVIRKTSADVWEIDSVGTTLQYYTGTEDLLELVKQDNVEAILNHDQAFSSGVLLACQLGKYHILEALLKANASMDMVDSSGKSLLHITATNGHVDCVKLLMQYHANVNQWDTGRAFTPLHCAACNGHLEVLKYLISCGADINASLGRRSALHYAVEHGSIECVRVLLENGANPNTLQVFSETPLHIAASLGLVEVMKLLLKYGSSVNVQCGRDKSTPLHLAAEDGSVECVKILLDAGANINALNYKRQTPLHIAATCQAQETLEMLLKRGADPNRSDVDGRTPLHCAIVKVTRSCEIIRLLWYARADVNKPDAFGYTPLHLAALNEFSNCVMFLISHGGDVTAKTKGGLSALAFITRRTPDVIPKYLLKFNNSITLTDHDIGDVDCELKLDFRILVPSLLKGETELLLNFIEVGHKDVLKHPLCETFLHLKWIKIRKFFLFSLFYHFLFVLLFTIYTIGVFVYTCEPNKHNDSKEGCKIYPTSRIVGYFLILLNIMLTCKEIFQIGHDWRGYIKEWENWLQWSIIISVFGCIITRKGEVDILWWQYDAAAIGIFLTWLELMMIVGRFPIFGLYIQMFKTVAVNFITFLFAYIWLLIAFGLSFAVLFSKYPAFNKWYLGLLKTIIMMSGELEFEDMFYADNYEIQFPVTTHIIFLAFVLLITVILTNLMVGLAVSDIQGLQQSAGLGRIARQAELVAHLESILFSPLLKCVPRQFLAFLHKQALLLKSRRKWAIYIRPNDPREERIPKELIKAIYDLVVEKKKRRFSNAQNSKREYKRTSSKVSTEGIYC